MRSPNRPCTPVNDSGADKEPLNLRKFNSLPQFRLSDPARVRAGQGPIDPVQMRGSNPKGPWVGTVVVRRLVGAPSEDPAPSPSFSEWLAHRASAACCKIPNYDSSACAGFLGCSASAGPIGIPPVAPAHRDRTAPWPTWPRSTPSTRGAACSRPTIKCKPSPRQADGLHALHGDGHGRDAPDADRWEGRPAHVLGASARGLRQQQEVPHRLPRPGLRRLQSVRQHEHAYPASTARGHGRQTEESHLHRARHPEGHGQHGLLRQP